MNIYRSRLLLTLILLPGTVLSELTHETDPSTGLESWNWQDDQVTVEMIQRLPDQTRGFFLARGFPPAAVERIALGCLFQTIIRNTGTDGPSVHIDLSKWQIRSGSSTKDIRLKSNWDQEWKETGVSREARIAFRWALFPTVQSFESGDYNWGMTTMDLPPGTRFDLHLTWLIDNEAREAIIPDMQCPLDRHPEPPALP